MLALVPKFIPPKEKLHLSNAKIWGLDLVFPRERILQANEQKETAQFVLLDWSHKLGGSFSKHLRCSSPTILVACPSSQPWRRKGESAEQQNTSFFYSSSKGQLFQLLKTPVQCWQGQQRKGERLTVRGLLLCPLTAGGGSLFPELDVVDIPWCGTPNCILHPFLGSAPTLSLSSQVSQLSVLCPFPGGDECAQQECP